MKANLIILPETTSTNDVADIMARDERPPEGTSILALHQTAGKGTGNHTWESEPGANLTFTTLFYPAAFGELLFSFNKAIALGIHDYLKYELTEASVCIKWPNDLYVENKKISGILIRSAYREQGIDYTLAGIGLNVNQINFAPNIPNPTSMKLHTGRDYALEAVFGKLFEHLAFRYQQFQKGNHQAIAHDYEHALWGIGELRKFQVGPKTFKARISHCDGSGELILRLPDGTRQSFQHKEIEFV